MFKNGKKEFFLTFREAKTGRKLVKMTYAKDWL